MRNFIQSIATLPAVTVAKARALMSKKEDGSHLLEVLGTIIIAIVLLILFKDKIVEIFTNALGTTSTSLTDLFN